MEVELEEGGILQAGEVIAEKIGVSFPRERWPELRRGIREAAGELGFRDEPSACIRWLAGNPPLTSGQIEILASYLTVGETYFLREHRHFEFLSERIIPDLLGRCADRRLRIWSAGCCTGEEAYSIAIALRRAIPDLDGWQVTIVATDINPRFLRRAEAGVYSGWSFRDAPEWLRSSYFRARPEGHFEVIPEIKRMVRFFPLNLARDAYPCFVNDLHAMDVIFCRNVLMYFTPAQARNVIEKMYRVQRAGGWLLVGSSEVPHLSSSPYVTVSTPNVTVFRRPPESCKRVAEPGGMDVALASRSVLESSAEIEERGGRIEAIDPHVRARALFEAGEYAEVVDFVGTLPAAFSRDTFLLVLMARSLANQGKLAEAIHYCDQSIEIDSCDAAGHYFRAMILNEQGARDEAVEALRRTLFLEPRFVLAHTALGMIERDRGQLRAAGKHLGHALELLQAQEPTALLPESEGMTAGELERTIRALMQQEGIL